MKHILFIITREEAFRYWQTGTRRDCQLENDDITWSFECDWQDRARDEFGYQHISIFCSLGEWASNISDILKDDSCDYYDFLNEDDRQALFRYYTRLLLVVSEILSDFEKLVQETRSAHSKIAREFLSEKKGDVDSLDSFVNNVCKHKVGGMHRSNHHLPIWFEDSPQGHVFRRPISLLKLNFDQPDGILMPRLNHIIAVVLACYSRLDDLFGKEPDKFRIICDEYDGKSYLE